MRSVSTQFVFFSSRRRHTRFDCDWSSDVCSSDLLWGLHTPKSGRDHGGGQVPSRGTGTAPDRAPSAATACSGGIQNTSSLSGTSAQGMHVIVAGSTVTLVWFHADGGHIPHPPPPRDAQQRRGAPPREIRRAHACTPV